MSEVCMGNVTFQFQCSSESTNGTGVQGGQIPELIFYGPTTITSMNSPTNSMCASPTRELMEGAGCGIGMSGGAVGGGGGGGAVNSREMAMAARNSRNSAELTVNCDDLLNTAAAAAGTTTDTSGPSAN